MKPIIASAAALLLAGALAGCSSAQSGPVAGTTSKATAAAKGTPSATPTPSTAPAELGTRTNPFPNGKPGKYDSSSVWTFTWQNTKGDGAADLKAVDAYATPAPSGQNFVLGSLTVQADSTMPADGADPVGSWKASYVGNDGNTYTDNGYCGQLPGTATYNLGRMYPNATQTGTVCAVVPASAVVGGSWRIDALVGSASSAFFKGA